MALDEPRRGDTTVEEEGLAFLFDRKAVTLVGELVIDYDDETGFTVFDETVPGSQC